jgi:hypothetical protein
MHSHDTDGSLGREGDLAKGHEDVLSVEVACGERILRNLSRPMAPGRELSPAETTQGCLQNVPTRGTSFSHAARPLLNSARLTAKDAATVRPPTTSSASLTRLVGLPGSLEAAAMLWVHTEKWFTPKEQTASQRRARGGGAGWKPGSERPLRTGRAARTAQPAARVAQGLSSFAETG